jgi:hypothetical protein
MLFFFKVGQIGSKCFDVNQKLNRITSFSASYMISHSIFFLPLPRLRTKDEGE